jgi:hypothetical protein
MTDKAKTSGGPRITQDGHQPGKIDRGHQPAFTPNNPGAGHQTTGSGEPKPPRGEPAVTLPPAKK